MHGGNHVAIRRLMGGIVENAKAVFLDSSFIILSRFSPRSINVISIIYHIFFLMQRI